VAKAKQVTWLLRAIVVLLSLQFVLGIWVNLFGSFPSTDSVSAAVMYGGDPVLTGHYLLAVVLLLLAVVVVYVSIRPGVPARLRWYALGGLLSIVWAWAAGLEFILSGFSNGGDSFSMALAFIVAMTFYGLAQAAMLPRAPPVVSLNEHSAVTPPP